MITPSTASLPRAVLLFSGGRDSTLAAMALHEQGYSLSLVTLTAEHLQGIERVRARLAELATTLPSTTMWARYTVRTDDAQLPRLNGRTCLPCQRDYAAVGALIAIDAGVSNVAFGYSRYQSTWPEQTPAATIALRAALQKVGLTLLLPVYDVVSKADAMEMLARHGLSTSALEQKCSKQTDNLELTRDELALEIPVWTDSILHLCRAVDRPQIDLVEHAELSAFRGARDA